MNDLISRQAAIDNLISYLQLDGEYAWGIRECLNSLPSAQSELLTDKEQRIFLAAMCREEKVCKEVDAEMTIEPIEPYEDSLVRVCHEITRKVKKALWTN